MSAENQTPIELCEHGTDRRLICFFCVNKAPRPFLSIAEGIVAPFDNITKWPTTKMLVTDEIEKALEALAAEKDREIARLKDGLAQSHADLKAWMADREVWEKMRVGFADAEIASLRSEVERLKAELETLEKRLDHQYERGFLDGKAGA